MDQNKEIVMKDIIESISFCLQIPFFDKSMCDILEVGEKCEKIIGYQMVYRIWLAYFLFFLAMALLMIGVRSSQDPRGGIHKG